MHSRRWSPAWVGLVPGTREMLRTLEQEGQTGGGVSIYWRGVGLGWMVGGRKGVQSSILTGC